MRLIFLFVLISTSFASCTDVLFLHLNNLHPARLSRPAWPFIYQEIIVPIKEYLPLLFNEKTALDRVIEWIPCLFQGSEIRNMYVSSPKDDKSRFEAGQLIYPGTPLFNDNKNEIVLAETEGFVLSKAVIDQGTHNKEIIALICFHPSMPPYDVRDVLQYFEKYKIRRPSILKAIPERAFYHPNYSPEPPFNSSHLLFYITNMINQILFCICARENKILNEFMHQMRSRSFNPEIWLLIGLWRLLIPYTNWRALDISDIPGDKILTTGEIIPFKQSPNERAVATCTLSDIGVNSSSQLIAIIPEYVVAPPMEGYKLLEYFYAQKFYDYALGKPVKEVEVLIRILIQRTMTHFKVPKSTLDEGPKLKIVYPDTTDAEFRSIGILMNDCIRHSQKISTRFESGAVRKKVYAQYGDEFYNWMSPGSVVDLSSLGITQNR